MFGFKKKKTIDEMTIEEIEKYLDERKSSEESEQDLEDRVDESVAEQEKESDTEDTQDAKDRVDESIGEEVAEEEREEEKDEAQDEAIEENKNDADERWAILEDRIAKIEAYIQESKKSPKEVGSETADKLSELERKFG